MSLETVSRGIAFRAAQLDQDGGRQGEMRVYDPASHRRLDSPRTRRRAATEIAICYSAAATFAPQFSSRANAEDLKHDF